MARIIRTAPAGRRCWATTPGAGTASIPTTGPPGSSPSTPLVAARDPHFFPELGLAPHRPGALLLFEADLPNHVEDAGGFESQKIEALLCHHSQFESTMGIASDDGRDGTVTPDAVPGGTARPARPERAAADGYAAFAAKVRHQLMAHGSLADRRSGEAFHRITAL